MTTTLFKQGAHIAAGRYVLERRLGSGGMATVWLARDTRLARPVAVKLPSEALASDDAFGIRFEREAQTAAALSHPNLVSVYDYGCEGDRPYLVSEYIDGANLAELRARGEEPPTADLARALLVALAHIHAAGIVHRDIKPGNVLVDSAGHILITDFGIAQSSGEMTLTAEGHVVGTPSYLAPEVKRGDRADARSDLYAVGILLREQLNDRDPDRIARLVDALTDPDPAARPRDAAQAMELIERQSVVVPTQRIPVEDDDFDFDDAPGSVREIHSPSTPPRSFPLPPPSEAQRERPWGLIAGGLVGVLLIAVLAFAALSGGGGDDGSQMQASTSKKERSGDKGSASAAAATAEAPPADTTEAVPEESTTAEPAESAPVVAGLPTPDPEPDPVRGAELNAQGKELLDAGDPAGAVPILEQAVAAYPADSTELDFGYALFNYAQALRLSGNPEAAIPVLERRMQIDDQLDAVKAELKEAKKAAKG